MGLYPICFSPQGDYARLAMLFQHIDDVFTSRDKSSEKSSEKLIIKGLFANIAEKLQIDNFHDLKLRLPDTEPAIHGFNRTPVPVWIEGAVKLARNKKDEVLRNRWLVSSTNSSSREFPDDVTRGPILAEMATMMMPLTDQPRTHEEEPLRIGGGPRVAPVETIMLAHLYPKYLKKLVDNGSSDEREAITYTWRYLWGMSGMLGFTIAHNYKHKQNVSKHKQNVSIELEHSFHNMRTGCLHWFNTHGLLDDYILHILDTEEFPLVQTGIQRVNEPHQYHLLSTVDYLCRFYPDGRVHDLINNLEFANPMFPGIEGRMTSREETEHEFMKFEEIHQESEDYKAKTRLQATSGTSNDISTYWWKFWYLISTITTLVAKAVEVRPGTHIKDLAISRLSPIDISTYANEWVERNESERDTYKKWVLNKRYHSEELREFLRECHAKSSKELPKKTVSDVLEKGPYQLRFFDIETYRVRGDFVLSTGEYSSFDERQLTELQRQITSEYPELGEILRYIDQKPEEFGDPEFSGAQGDPDISLTDLYKRKVIFGFLSIKMEHDETEKQIASEEIHSVISSFNGLLNRMSDRGVPLSDELDESMGGSLCKLCSGEGMLRKTSEVLVQDMNQITNLFAREKTILKNLLFLHGLQKENTDGEKE